MSVVTPALFLADPIIKWSFPPPFASMIGAIALKIFLAETVSHNFLSMASPNEWFDSLNKQATPLIWLAT